ncbi:acyltransferase [Azospirillum brasilense]|uniref:acyltransferase n=1 Tax=Azospirillum brasilense TaxID=192 RepID=UPI0011C4AC13|nr:hypothetical protein [Azospirillum brasilense]NUB24858.1 hypothetical protein [Azospirillum brasilense]NUB32533.1 hypothetical protein [Azospirillum brasilense]
MGYGDFDMEDIRKIISMHKAWGEYSCLFGMDGYSMPEFSSPLFIKAEDETSLRNYGITIDGETGHNNIIIVDAQQQRLSLIIRVKNCTGVKVIIGKGEAFGGRIDFNGTDCIFVSSGFGYMGCQTKLSVALASTCGAFFGKGATSVSSQWIIEGNWRSSIVADDLMASWGVVVRNYDSHSLFDLENGEVINSPNSLHIGPHCWIGQDTKIVRGVDISYGSVIGAGSVVVGNVTPCSVAAGVPAKVVREKASWSRAYMAPSSHVEAIKSSLEGYSNTYNFFNNKNNSSE